MARFNRSVTLPPATPLLATTGARAVNPQGGTGFQREPKAELFLLAASYLDGNRFYGTAEEQDNRFRELVHKLAVAEPEWTYELINWLRNGANLRTIALMGAAEYVKARLDANAPPLYVVNGQVTAENPYNLRTGVHRALVDAVLRRPDEPGEMLAYWLSRYGRAIPKPVKRGVADAALRMYNEKAYIKWDSEKASVRFADVLELAHVPGTSGWRNALYSYALDVRHHARKDIPVTLPTLTRRARLLAMPQSQRAPYLLTPQASDELNGAGITWEALSSWVGRALKGQEWQAILPSMGLMAVVRNARNIDNAQVDPQALLPTFARLMDAEEVKRSRMLPFRFLSAYRHSHLRWHGALDAALTHSLSNVPALTGRTLILVDRSGSMFCTVSERSELTFADTAALFGTALALRAQAADLVQFGSSSAPVQYARNESPLQVMGRFGDMGGTYTAQAVQRWFNGHDRVIILTDEQVAHYGSGPTAYVPTTTPVYTWNLAGYRLAHAPAGPNRYSAGGLSDQSFSLIPMLEAASKGAWPWSK
jgi:hypothetical protein